MKPQISSSGPLAQTAFQRNGAGLLCCDGLPLSEVSKTFGTPTYVYSERTIVEAFQRFTQAASGRNTLICYALKANSSLGVIRLLAAQGAGFDIVSLGELQRVIAAGGQADRIVFSGVGKTQAEIAAALQAGIKCINVESAAELEMVAQTAGQLNTVAPISLRVNPDIDAQTHPYISTGLKDNKFGIPMDQAETVYRRAQALPSISIQGIDCHIGSQITSLAPFIDALSRVLALADRLAAAGITLHHLDLGGGLGICYDQETPPAPQALLDAVFARLADWQHTRATPLPEVLFEFGRAIVGNAGVLLTRVELLKPSEHKNFAIIDAAMNDLMRPALYEAWHAVELVAPATTNTKRWDLVGPVCESGDWIARDRELGLAQGDLLAILSAGAYGMSMSSNYNSRPRAAEVLVDREGRAHLIRRREEFSDLIGPERIPDHLRG
ncbi:MAG: diaminopimelate decarboxylase [Burkholderiaceae bacterium]|nr:diaminopimelate decarboxylase [Burkholderiaceae bacterium]